MAADKHETMTVKGKITPERADNPYQLASHFSISHDGNGFFLAFSAADPYLLGENRVVPVHPVAKVFVGRNLMEEMIQILLGYDAVRELPALKKVKELAEKELAALQVEAGSDT
jgi:hypothetical protein